MRWPAGTRLLAIDRSPAMIRHVWPKDKLRIAARSVCASWERLPVESGSMAAVVGDGFYAQPSYPAGYLRLGEEIRRVLRPDGLYVMRAFVRPDDSESPADVFDALRSKGIGNFHIFKLRLAMSMQDSAPCGVRLADVWATWHEHVPDPAALARALRWPIDEIATMDAYRDSDASYAFPTIAELRQTLDSHFIELECHQPNYEIGNRCPTFVLGVR